MLGYDGLYLISLILRPQKLFLHFEVLLWWKTKQQQQKISLTLTFAHIIHHPTFCHLSYLKGKKIAGKQTRWKTRKERNKVSKM